MQKGCEQMRIKAIALLLLAGCNLATAPSPSSATTETAITSVASSKSVASEKDYTTEDVIQCFYNLEYSKGCTVTDCVLANDSAYDLIGVVQYTDEHGNDCNLSFIIKNSTGAPVGLDAEGHMNISNDSVLTYLQNGTVTLSLIDPATQKTYDYSVEYSYSKENNGTNFVLLSKESSSQVSEE
jgi:hypothetical protein